MEIVGQVEEENFPAAQGQAIAHLSTENAHLARLKWDSSPEKQLEHFFHKNNNPSQRAAALFPFPWTKLPE